MDHVYMNKENANEGLMLRIFSSWPSLRYWLILKPLTVLREVHLPNFFFFCSRTSKAVVSVKVHTLVDALMNNLRELVAIHMDEQ